ncbi:MAG: undecaprenyldiphospho-muramoylpentapeptide beta-N-acetylglucosaminyltransferase [Nitrospirota bacterium]
MKVLLACGGTGGHLYPGIALAREFQRRDRDTDILFAGTERGIETMVLHREGLRLALIRVEGLIGKGKINAIYSLFLLPCAFFDSLKILIRFRPDIVIGIGGYSSGPILLMALFLRKNCIILEPNMIPGVTNRILAPLVKYVVTSFEDSKKYFIRANIVRIGNPVRREMVKEEETGENKIKTIFIFGGSQGAHSINMAVIDALSYLEDLKERISFIHQTGKKDYEYIKEEYEKIGFNGRIEPYIYDMAEAYNMADIVISRAGATTIAEITAIGIPAILIPYPYATHDHQRKNAESLADAGAAIVIDDRELSGEVLSGVIRELIDDNMRLKKMKENSRALGNIKAAEEIVELCMKLI